jgi:hypothetical protein
MAVRMRLAVAVAILACLVAYSAGQVRCMHGFCFCMGDSWPDRGSGGGGALYTYLNTVRHMHGRRARTHTPLPRLSVSDNIVGLPSKTKYRSWPSSGLEASQNGRADWG